MKQIAACLLVAFGVGAAGYCADKMLVPLVNAGFDVNADTSYVNPAFIPEWHFKEPHFRKLCFGLCPEMENWP
jgi:hypothetical protein